MFFRHNSGKDDIPYKSHVMAYRELVMQSQVLERDRAQASNISSTIIDGDGSSTSQGRYNREPETSHSGNQVDGLAGLTMARLMTLECTDAAAETNSGEGKGSFDGA